MINHKLNFCYHCGVYMYTCGICKNNTCNGGYGKINGETCKDCPEAYKLSNNFHLNIGIFRNLVQCAFYSKSKMFRIFSNFIYELKEYFRILK